MEVKGIKLKLLNGQELRNGKASDKSYKSFAETLKDEVEKLNQVVKKAEFKAVEIASGKNDDILGAVVAATEAELAVKAAVQIRNKILQTYQTFVHMQV
ncbi:MAG: flagellar hook-basal body complex protein FliE [Desulfurobacteriaceae bacterium]